MEKRRFTRWWRIHGKRADWPRRPVEGDIDGGIICEIDGVDEGDVDTKGANPAGLECTFVGVAIGHSHVTRPRLSHLELTGGFSGRKGLGGKDGQKKQRDALLVFSVKNTF